MAVVITQSCDGCDDTRILRNLESVNNGGWRRVGDYGYLCVKCLKGVFRIKEKEAEKEAEKDAKLPNPRLISDS